MNKLAKTEAITDKLNSKDYEGVDVDLTISLGEYGIIGKSLPDNQYKVLYKVNYKGQDYYTFHTIDKHYIADLMYSIDQRFLDYVDQDFETWLKLPIINQLQDLVNYHGYMNIFGDMRDNYTLDQLYSEVTNE